MTVTPMPLLTAVQSALSDIEANRGTPFDLQIMACFAELVRAVTAIEGTEPANCDTLARAIYLSFWAGWKARAAADDEVTLKQLIQE